MRPLRLEFCGINSFSEPAEVDFTRLLEFGIFGIFGDTGSGKSTILDCIGFALYGNVTRLRSGSISELINYRADKAYVRFEFEIAYDGKRRVFRVERELKRKNAVQSVCVYEREGDALHALAEGVRESNALLERIIGLEQKDFEKCIALPQGEFAQFVKTQRSDRLKLISRLFDLEEYGERLVKKANARCAALTAERSVLLARIEPFANYSAEKNEAARESLARLEREALETVKSLESAREREKSLSEGLKSKQEAERVKARLAVLKEREGEIGGLEKELDRLERSAFVVKAKEDLREAEKAKKFSAEKLGETQAEQRAAKAALAATQADDGAEEDEIARLTEQRARAEHAEQTKKRAAELSARLEETRSAYVREAAQFKGFSYEEKRAALTKEQDALGKENFLQFAETHGKAMLPKSEYERFVGDLSQIYLKYPETAEDMLPLIEKYQKLSEGEKRGFAALRHAFEEREARRGELQAALLDLEKQNGRYRVHCNRLQQLQTEGERIKADLAALGEQTAETAELKAVTLLLEQKRNARRTRLEALGRAQKALAVAEAAFARAEESARNAALYAAKAERELSHALAAYGFRSAEEAEELLKRLGDAEGAKLRVKQFREELAALLAREKELENAPAVTEEEATAAREALHGLQQRAQETLQELALARERLARAEEGLERKRALEKELKKTAEKAEISERLKKLLDGNKFMEYAAEEYLQNVAQEGSGRLLSLTGGRYFLRYDGGFLVGDNLAGGSLRGVYTLSGGETFLVSLSLALALSSQICKKSLRPIEFFFLDEGFGTLDEQLVDVVMDSLEKLKGQHFSIGIISHVEELKHRIERKLSVEKATETHGSRIRF